MTKKDGCRTVRIRETTIVNLKKVGKMGESYNDVIDRLIEKEINNC